MRGGINPLQFICTLFAKKENIVQKSKLIKQVILGHHSNLVKEFCEKNTMLGLNDLYH